MQSETLFDFGMEIRVLQRHDTVGFFFLLSPDNGRALALERQDRERTGRQEMLLGAAIVIALMRDRRDNAGLSVLPAEALDAGLLANRRSRTVGGNQELCRDCFAIRQNDSDAAGVVLETPDGNRQK